MASSENQKLHGENGMDSYGRRRDFRGRFNLQTVSMTPLTGTELKDLDFSAFKASYEKFREISVKCIQERFPTIPRDAIDWIRTCTDYNVPHGKLNRGLLVIEAAKALHQSAIGESLPVITVEDVECLAWCVEWLQSYFLVADDVMDGSELRRGKQCWYRRPGVGMIAINDTLLLRSSVDVLLKNQFFNNSSDSRFYRLKDLFVEVELATQLGQLLDMTSGNFLAQIESRQISASALFHRYYQMIDHKTALYSFYLPFAAALLLFNEQPSQEERAILIDIGRLFQVQDDVLDVFGDPETTGKIGTDIEEGKCTWPLCTLLSQANFTQADLSLLYKNYGNRNDHEASKLVKSLYHRYDIKEKFIDYELNATSILEQRIASLPRASSRSAFRHTLHKIIKRIK